MDDRFEVWVRAMCGGAFAVAAYAVGLTREPPWLAIPFGVAAIGFAVWPERLAYAYRHGKGVPGWSRPRSVTEVTAAAPPAPAGSYAAYRPRLEHLASAFTSCVGYVVILAQTPRSSAEWQAAVILLGAAAIIWYAGHKDSERRAAGEPPWDRPPGM